MYVLVWIGSAMPGEAVETRSYCVIPSTSFPLYQISLDNTASWEAQVAGAGD